MKEATTKNDKIPDWVLNSSFNSNNKNQSNNHILVSDSFSFDQETRSHESLIKNLQDELTKTKEQLIDQQTNFLQLQSQHRQDLEEKTSSFNSSITLVYKEFANLLKHGLLQQREVCYKEFKALLEKQNAEQEKAIARKLEDMQKKYESHFSEKFEKRLAEFQENLIKLNQSEYEDTELKIKKIVTTMLKDEQSSEKVALKQQLDQIKKELKQETEKSVNQYFISHNEDFKVTLINNLEKKNPAAKFRQLFTFFFWKFLNFSGNLRDFSGNFSRFFLPKKIRDQPVFFP